jgi:cardiolipin synthase (CMP-forming)
LRAPVGDAFYDSGRDLLVELAGCKIIQEQQRLSALNDNVVDAHGHKVNADRTVRVALDGDLHLRADAVVGGDQDGVDKSCRLKIEQSAESAKLRARSGTACGASERPDSIHNPVADIDVDPRIGVGERLSAFWHLDSQGFEPDRVIAPAGTRKGEGRARFPNLGDFVLSVGSVIPMRVAKSKGEDGWAAAPGRQYLMNIGNILHNLPNFITLARMLMTPLAVMMIISQRFLPAFLIFILAGVSDAIDGFIAKRFDLRTELGAYLDPLADKALLISIYVSLAIYAGLPAWVAITVVSRDVMILVAVLVSWLLDKPVEIRPVWVSKLNTVAQITLAGFALGVRAYGLDQQLLQTTLQWTVAATTLASGGVYIAQWLDHMSR